MLVPQISWTEHQQQTKFCVQVASWCLDARRSDELNACIPHQKLHPLTQFNGMSSEQERADTTNGMHITITGVSSILGEKWPSSQAHPVNQLRGASPELRGCCSRSAVEARDVYCSSEVQTARARYAAHRTGGRASWEMMDRSIISVFGSISVLSRDRAVGELEEP
eukprot:5454610-Pleurochrysis_carterae.AAC.5